MDYPTFGIPWSVFNQYQIRNFADDVGSVCSTTSSPPLSPMSPSPSLASSNDGEESTSSTSSSFHFKQTTMVNSGHNLCHQVPALFGLDTTQYHHGLATPPPPGHLTTKNRPALMAAHGSTSSVGRHNNSRTASNGFYKRLMEWLSRKKKSHRRYSHQVDQQQSPDMQTCYSQESLHGFMAVASNGRNQSAPMIFDVHAISNRQQQQQQQRITNVNPRIECPSSFSASSSSSASSSMSPSNSSLSSSSSLSSAHLPPSQQMTLSTQTSSQTNCTAANQRLELPTVGESRLGFEAPPTTPTSSYNQSGIITTHFDKQEMMLSEADKEIDPEWIIPWSDIQFGQIISQKGSCTINRGKWHGDVIIHQFKLQNDVEVSSFWSDVQSLSKLRHENLLLFMGIAIPSLGSSYTIVNSAPRGVSVANFRLGLKNGKPERIGMRAAVSISRQVAQATGYLHARGIIHGKLNPHNIFLEGDNYRVKLSLLDHGLVDTASLQIDYGCIPKTQVSYYSPELIRSMIVEPPEVHFTIQSTKFSDVYALGSFMYDLISGSPPFHQEQVDSILWRIGNGQTTSLQDVNCNARLKALMTSCWARDPSERPSCVEVVRRLQPSALLCKSHSCSEPERLNRLGQCKLAC